MTDVGEASRFLAAVRRRDVLSINCSDADRGYRLSVLQNRRRGRSLSASDCIVTAGRPRRDLSEYHRGLGIGPSRLYVLRRPSWRVPLPRLVLEEPGLVERLRSDRALRALFLFFKDRVAEELQERLGFEPVYCAPAAAVYEQANDKIAFAEAARDYGFRAVPSEEIHDAPQLAEAYGRLASEYGEGCVLRGRRGAGGSGIRRAGSVDEAERIWTSLRRLAPVVIQPYVPASRILHNICVNGIVCERGFAPVCLSEQVQKGMRFRGGRIGHAWTDEEVGAVRETMAGVARWLRHLGYVDAPVGIDGFLVREGGTLRFVALDPNVRVTGSMLAWTVSAAMCEKVNTPFVWAFEWRRIVGRPLSMRLLRQRLGSLLVEPGRIEGGGILPRDLSTLGVWPLGISWISVLYLARDADHLDRLQRAVRRLGVYVD